MVAFKITVLDDITTGTITLLIYPMPYKYWKNSITKNKYNS